MIDAEEGCSPPAAAGSGEQEEDRREVGMLLGKYALSRLKFFVQNPAALFSLAFFYEGQLSSYY